MSCLMPLKTQEQYILDAKAKHNNKYSYHNLVYINDKSYVTVTCPIHGDYEQGARSHLNGRGCHKCYLENKAYDTKTFIDKARTIHLDYYDYSKVVYTLSREKVTITCPEHGDFPQTPNDHLSGKGCLKCGLKRLNGAYNDTFFEKFPELKTKESILYLVKVTNTKTSETFWKVGITALASVQKRYAAERNHKFEVVVQKTLPLFEAYRSEQQLISENKQHQYTPADLKSGHTECFSIPIKLPL